MRNTSLPAQAQLPPRGVLTWARQGSPEGAKSEQSPAAAGVKPGLAAAGAKPGLADAKRIRGGHKGFRDFERAFNRELQK